ncbi:hypothetical protein Cyrtocomes_00771 [Candidatus Cyrtobacter comes]|uniref:Uncharacterized protein n=1 Tax=Candidatus Cyrtobacter comes TaxID=675776 RepID=A0ABU5L8E1_9RICK|nr:hypothetical protein [Candidatus Cyrtobacter comes]MDZ5762391.1 hypothetical protein [Candidatus Cyrtobacter comes]
MRLKSLLKPLILTLWNNVVAKALRDAWDGAEKETRSSVRKFISFMISNPNHWSAKAKVIQLLKVYHALKLDAKELVEIMEEYQEFWNDERKVDQLLELGRHYDLTYNGINDKTISRIVKSMETKSQILDNNQKINILLELNAGKKADGKYAALILESMAEYPIIWANEINTILKVAVSSHISDTDIAKLVISMHEYPGIWDREKDIIYEKIVLLRDIITSIKSPLKVH